MAKKKQLDIRTDYPPVLQLDAKSRKWIRKTEGVPGYSTEDGNYDILQGDGDRGYVVLVSFIHDPLPGDACEFWRKRFSTVKEAMEYAERM